MKRVLRAAAPLALGAALLVGGLTTANATEVPFTDIGSHWARTTLTQAYEDGILKGTSATTMSPNQSITKAQAITVLCRILGVTGKGDVSGLNIPSHAWYAGDAAKGVYLGLLDGDDAGTLDKPLTRGEAFVLFGQAFQKLLALPGVDDALANFSDGPYLTHKAVRFAAANLIDSKVVNGIDGALKTDQPLSRAEFVTMLYRIVDRYSPAEGYGGQRTGGAVLSGDADLNGVKAADLWFDQTSSRIHLTDTSALWAVVRSDKLEELTIEGSGHIGQLVIANNQGDVDLNVPDSFNLSVVSVGSGSGEVTVGGSIFGAEVIGDGRTVTVNATGLSNVIISGNGNTVTVNNAGETLDDLILTGENNTVILNGNALRLYIEGRDNTVRGPGRVSHVNLFTRYYNVDVKTGAVNQWDSYDLSKVKVQLDAPKVLAAGETLKATAHLTCSDADKGKLCTGSWYLNGQLAEESPVILGSGDPVSHITVDYTHDLQQEATLQYVLTYENNDGDTFTQSGYGSVYLETFSDLGLADTAVEVTAPARLAPGQALSATAVVTSPESGKVCTGSWTIDGKEVAHGPVTLGTSQPYMTYKFDYYYGLPENSTVALTLTYTTEDGREQSVSGSAQVAVENYPDNGIARGWLSLGAVNTLPAGQTLEVTAYPGYLEAGKTCTGTWYVDGKAVSTQTVVLGRDTPKLSHKYTYTEDMKRTSEVTFVLSYTTQDGRKQELSAAKTITLQNYDYSYYHGPTPQEALNTVTSNYAGNYTLAWALNHDYSKEIKTAWVNAKGYSSRTQYLIWVNLTYQRVNIFQGAQGNWTLIRECLCGSGKPSTPTIRGVFATTYKQSSWNYGSYYCGPVVRFYGGYAFHSRLEYWPMGSGRYYDGRIGFPISHGCLRMYDDDIWFIYNNIPNGTTVVVY